MEKKQKTYAAFLSFLLKQEGIEGGEEVSTEPIKSSSSEISYGYSQSNSICSFSSRISSNTFKKKRKVFSKRKNNKLNNEMFKSSKTKEESNTSSNNWASEEDLNEIKEINIVGKELTKEQLLEEMNKVGKHLEWIWAQLGGKTSEENEEEENNNGEEEDEKMNTNKKEKIEKR